MTMRDDVPDVTTLRILRAIGVTGSFRQAAVTAGMSQQATSARIKAAEDQLGMSLVARSQRGSSLTVEGQLLVEWSAGLLEQADHLATAIHALRSDTAARLTVAASQTIAESFVPGWMAKYRRRSRDAQTFRVTSGNSAFVVDEVRSGRADVGLVETPEVPDDLAHAHIRDDELVVIVAPEHRWAEHPAISASLVLAKQLAAEPLITREAGSGTRRTLELAIQQDHPELRLAEPVAVLSSTGAIRAAVRGGMGATVISAATVRDDLERGTLVAVPVADLTLSRPFTAVWRIGVPLPPAAKTLFAILRE